MRSLSVPERSAIRGLSDDRADSIVGGAACLGALMRTLELPELIVSGGGLREGLAAEAAGLRVFNAEQSRHRSVNGLARRFSSWNPLAAGRRADIVALLMGVVEPALDAELTEVVQHCAALLDVGRAVDYYDRLEHTESIVLGAQLSGFTHRAVALMAAVIRRTESEKKSLKSYQGLLDAADEVQVARASALLALADGIAGQFPPSESDLTLRCERKSAHVALLASWLDAWPLAAVVGRFERAFGVAIDIRPGASGDSIEAA